MGLLDFFRGKPKGLSAEALYDPQRFADFAPSHWQQFVHELSNGLERKKLQVKRQGASEIELESPSMILFLDNIANDWRDSEAEDKECLIDNYLTKCLSMYGRNDFTKEEALSNLCIRCYGEFTNNDDQFYVKNIGEYFFLVITVYYEESFCALNKKDTCEWGLNDDIIWEMAFSSIMESGDLKLIQKGDDKEFLLYVLEHRSSPAIAYRLIETDPSLMGELGAFWLPISTSMAAVVPVHSSNAIDIVNQQASVLSQSYLEDYRPISINLYWWKPDGSWQVIPATQGLNKMYFYESPLAP